MTDFQRIVIYFVGVAAVFLTAMAWGWQNLWLLLAAIGLVLVAVVSVVVVATRRGAGAHEIVTAQVVWVAPPPHDVGIAARCDMRLEVRLPGRPPVQVKHRDPAVALERWPRPGQTFPVDVYGGNPRRRLRIRWDLVGQGISRAPDGARPESGGATSQAPMWEEENEPIIFSPTPPRTPRPRGPQSPAAPPSAPPTPPPPAAPAADTPASGTETALFLHETFTDIDDATVPTTPPTRRSPGAAGNGHDPYGYDPADFEAPRLTPAPAPATTGGPGFETLALSEFDPAEVDIRDFTDEPPAVTVMPPEEDDPAATSKASPPSASPASPASPRDQAPPDPPAAEGSPSIPQPRDPDGVSGNRDD